MMVVMVAAAVMMKMTMMMIMMMNGLLYEIQTHTEQMNANFTRTIQNNSQIFRVNPSVKVTKQQLNGDK